MDRRTFVSGLTLGLLAAPLAAGAQPAGKVYRVGYVWIGAPGSESNTVDGLRQGLKELGYVEGQNIVIEDRYANGKIEALPGLMAELIRLNVDVILAPGPPVTQAAQRATSTIPIISTTGDPLGLDFVSSLARPGGNITGLSLGSGPELAGKRLQLLKEAFPKIRVVAYLWNPTNADRTTRFETMATMAPGLQLVLHSFPAKDADDLTRGLGGIAKLRPSAIILPTDAFLVSNRVQIVVFAAKTRLPALYGVRDFADSGGLMSYGASIFDIWRRVAHYMDKILKGAKPGDLPVEQPTKFDLVINLKTAKALGLAIPPSLLQRADQVIE